MIKLENPWLQMETDTKRRVNANEYIEFNWINDKEDRYCFGMIFSKKIDENKSRISMKHIDVFKGNIDGCGNIQLLLLDKSNWEVFKRICDDLISHIEENINNTNYENLVEQRLLRWKSIFQKYSDFLSFEKQMGLICELNFLKENIATEYSIGKAIEAWCGPSGDNQDFAIGDSIYEIKSYILTKGECISISSSKQLEILSSKMYLITIGILKDDTGITIQDMVEAIEKLIGSDSELKASFNNKLYEYGYMKDAIGNKSLHRFAFKAKTAYVVEDDFPRVLSKDIDNRITEFTYRIDMSKCREYKVDIDKVIKGDVLCDNNK